MTNQSLFPAMKSTGLTDEATRRAWQEHRYEGSRPVYSLLASSVEGLSRAALPSGCESRLARVILGLSGEAGELNGQRLAVIRVIERVNLKDTRVP